MGLTRIANITGLDHVGVPVAVACRPNSRALSVAQGKGLDIESAMVSAAMESIESYHAEQIDAPLRFASVDDLRQRHRVAETAGLPKSTPFEPPPTTPLLWMQAIDWCNGEPAFVPFEAVSTNYTIAARAVGGLFQATSNGLASGNHLLEAISHAICEVIERDATALWSLRPAQHRARTRVDLTTVDDPDCRSVLDAYERSGLDVGVWELTSDVGLASFRCAVVDRDDGPLAVGHSGTGMGCHCDRSIALFRALSEAAQSRLTYIAGSRDDLLHEHYSDVQRHVSRRRIREQLASEPPARSFHDAPTVAHAGIGDDVAWQVDRLRGAGIDAVFVVDLTRPEFGIPVVRVLVPGLEGVATAPGYVPGRRARAVIEAAQ